MVDNEHQQYIQEFIGIKQRFSELIGERNAYRIRLAKQRASVERLKQELLDGEQARIIIQEEARSTLSNLEFHISNLVTSALQTIPFPEPISFTAQFQSFKDRIECHLYFIKQGRLIPPMLASGGGPKDIGAFALRITYWTLRKNRPTFWLDEPFRNADVGIQPHVGEMVKRLCDKLNIQIIMNSHQPEIDIRADKIFWFEKVDGSARLVRSE